MNEAGVLENLSPEEFRSVILNLLSIMNYSAGSEGAKKIHDGFSIFATKSEPLGDIKTLIYAFLPGKEASHTKVKDVFDEAKRKNASKVVLISPGGLSDSAHKFALKHEMGIVDRKMLDDLIRKHHLYAQSKNKIFELSFDLGRSLDEAKELFERERGKKLLGFGVEEKVVEIKGRYAPVGSFILSRSEEVKTGFFKTSKTVSKSNMFYVNLSTGELYYISKGLGKPMNISSSKMLRHLMALSVESVRMLADIMKKGEMPLGELSEKYELFYEENKEDLRVLFEENLIALTPDRKGLMANIDLPFFGNLRYDLGKFIMVAKSVSSDYEVDERKYAPEDIVKLLELFYAGKGEVKEVFYMPYYTCKLTDDRGMSRSRTMLAPRYITGI